MLAKVQRPTRGVVESQKTADSIFGVYKPPNARLEPRANNDMIAQDDGRDGSKPMFGRVQRTRVGGEIAGCTQRRIAKGNVLSLLPKQVRDRRDPMGMTTHVYTGRALAIQDHAQDLERPWADPYNISPVSRVPDLSPERYPESN